MMLPEIARASPSKRRRKSGTGGEVLGENLHSYGTTEMAVAGTVDKDNHNHTARLPEVPRAVVARARADAARSASGRHGQMAP
jgi:hypothetical protein